MLRCLELTVSSSCLQEEESLSATSFLLMCLKVISEISLKQSVLSSHNPEVLFMIQQSSNVKTEYHRVLGAADSRLFCASFSVKKHTANLIIAVTIELILWALPLSRRCHYLADVICIVYAWVFVVVFSIANLIYVCNILKLFSNDKRQ